MVRSDEISQRLRDKREGTSSNGYLVCTNCGGYYKLQPGESWRDPQNLSKSLILMLQKRSFCKL